MNHSPPAIEILKGPRDGIEDAASHVHLQAHTGKRKEVNILTVCDGVGGSAYGEVASRRTIEFLSGYLSFVCQKALEPDKMKELVLEALHEANKNVLFCQEQNRSLKGMSTTVVVAVVIDGKVYVAWAGDSRCYLYSGHDQLRQITVDHSFTEYLIAQGKLDPKLASDHPCRHFIMQCLGKSEGFSPSVTVHDISDGDVLLLCSDGLTDVVDRQHLGRVLSSVRSHTITPQTAVERLTQLALELNTTDNVTAFLYQHHADPDQETMQTAASMYPEALQTIFQPEIERTTT